MNGRDDPRSVLKTAMGLQDDDKLHYGVRSQDVLSMFNHVVAKHAAEGTIVEYEWRRIGKNHSTKGEGWNGKDCVATFRIAGCYIVLGKAKRNNRLHIALMKSLFRLGTEEERLERYALHARGLKRIGHAVCVAVEEDGDGILIDNGSEIKPYCILSMASRMEDVSVCYKMDLRIV